MNMDQKLDETNETGRRSTAPAVDVPRPRRRLLLAPLLIFAAMVGLFAIALRKGDPSKLPSALIGKPVPELMLTPLEGLADPNGRPVPGILPGSLAAGPVTVVNFWASWCLPCVEEHPLLLRLKHEAGLRLVGINHKDQAANARRFLERYGNPFDAIGSDKDGRAAIEWGVYGMPETFVIDAQAKIVYKHIGPLSTESLEQRLLPAIERARRTK
jgi:cytochrome c biogenesis protein CcmG/thiol:disulfide interchange protein DsbE